MEVSSYFHGSLHAFSAEGSTELIKCFYAAVKNHDVRCKYNRKSDLFCIESPTELGETAYEIFTTLFSSFIEQYCKASQSDNVGIPKVRLLTEIGAGEFSDTFTDITKSDELDAVSIIDNAGRKEQLWKPTRVELDVSEIFLSSVTDEIAHCCNCKVVVDNDRHCVVITDGDEASYDSACRKLENLERHWYHTAKVTHVVETEKFQDASLQLSKLIDQPDDLLLRTLGNFPDALIDTLPTMRTCCSMRRSSPDGDYLFDLSSRTQALVPEQATSHIWDAIKFPYFTSSHVSNISPPQEGTCAFARLLPGKDGQRTARWVEDMNAIYSPSRYLPPEPVHAFTDLGSGKPPTDLTSATAQTMALHAVNSNIINTANLHVDLEPQQTSEAEDLLIDIGVEENAKLTKSLLPPGLFTTEGEFRPPSQVPDRMSSERASKITSGSSLQSLADLRSGKGVLGTDTATIAALGSQATSRTESLIMRRKKILAYEDTEFDVHAFETNVVRPNGTTQDIYEAPLPTPSEAYGPESKITGKHQRENQIQGAKMTCSAPEEQLINLEENNYEDEFPALGTKKLILAALPHVYHILEPVKVSSEIVCEDEIVERLQPASELDSRHFRRTMGQKAGVKQKKKPKKKKSVIKTPKEVNLPLPEWMPQQSYNTGHRTETPSKLVKPHATRTFHGTHEQKIATPAGASSAIAGYSSMLEALEAARSFRGEVTITIQIGKILMDYHMESTSKRAIKTEAQMQLALQKQQTEGKLGTHFTQLLTRSMEESQIIIGLPSADHESMFEPSSYREEAFYELFCDMQGHRTCVRVDAQKSYTVIDETKEFGIVYIHYPKRVWDARAAVDGHKVVGKLSTGSLTGLDALVDSISANKVAREDDGASVLSVQLESPSDELRIDRMHSLRRLYFRSRLLPDVALVATEVQNMEGFGAGKVYKFKALEPLAMARAARIWYEASIIPAEKHSALNKNIQLEIGEEAGWKPDQVLSEALWKQMKRVADQLITRIDGVGLTNEGPRGDDLDLATIAEKKKEHAQKVFDDENYFW